MYGSQAPVGFFQRPNGVVHSGGERVVLALDEGGRVRWLQGEVRVRRRPLFAEGAAPG